MWATAKGIIIATLSLVLLGAIALALPAALSGEPPLRWAAIGAYVMGPIALAALLILGLPAHFALRWSGFTSLRAYLWTGFLLASALSFALGFRLPDGARTLIALFEVALVLVGGPIAAAVFWYTVRPDRTQICVVKVSV